MFCVAPKPPWGFHFPFDTIDIPFLFEKAGRKLIVLFPYSFEKVLYYIAQITSVALSHCLESRKF